MQSEQTKLFHTRVAAYIAAHELLVPHKPIVVGLSGGADSVALLHVLLRLGYDCVAVHINYQLRGSESQRDEDFCRELCRQLGVMLLCFKHDTKLFAQQQKVSIEMAARDIRYKRFEEVIERFSAQAVAVAHHIQDNVETLLLNLVRGTGYKGLMAMKPRQGQIVRPLLGLTKKEILDYLSACALTYVSDSSNAVADVKRNKIRLEVLPLLAELNPSVTQTLHDDIARFSDAYSLYEDGLRQAKQRVTEVREGYALVVNIDALTKETAKRTILHELLNQFGFTNSQIKEIELSLRGRVGAKFYSQTHCLLRDRDYLLLSAELPIWHEEQKLTVGKTVIPNFGEITIEEKRREELSSLKTETCVALLDAEKIKGNLLCRRYKQGDCFQPLGMQGNQLVSDFLTNNKVNALEKERQLVIEDEQHIVWLVGRRVSDKYKVTTSTQRVWVLIWHCFI